MQFFVCFVSFIINRLMCQCVLWCEKTCASACFGVQCVSWRPPQLTTYRKLLKRHLNRGSDSSFFYRYNHLWYYMTLDAEVCGHNPHLQTYSTVKCKTKTQTAFTQSYKHNIFLSHRLKTLIIQPDSSLPQFLDREDSSVQKFTFNVQPGIH